MKIYLLFLVLLIPFQACKYASSDHYEGQVKLHASDPNTNIVIKQVIEIFNKEPENITFDGVKYVYSQPNSSNYFILQKSKNYSYKYTLKANSEQYNIEDEKYTGTDVGYSNRKSGMINKTLSWWRTNHMRITCIFE